MGSEYRCDCLALHQCGVVHAGIIRCPQQKYGIGMLVQVLGLCTASPAATRCATAWGISESFKAGVSG
jgi:hypothetical protein